jgi:muramoyltetrapeptide carboxypeptidase
MAPLRPARLRRGDLIGLVAPASPVLDPRRVDSGVRYLEGLGYRVEVGTHVLDRHGYLAGPDEHRLGDMNRMLSDRRVRAIFAVRGGYGTSRLLPFLDYGAVRRDPKIIVGYSDLTALQLALWRKTGLVTFSGPMVAGDFGRDPDPVMEEGFWKMLTSRSGRRLVGDPMGWRWRAGRPGVAEGRLLGGNLSLVTTVLGTPFSPDYRGALLILEEVGEAPYRLDRMLTQLRNAGVLRRVVGLVLGQFTGCRPARGGTPALTRRQMFDEVLSGLTVPVLEGLAYGHVRSKVTVPVGVRARMDAGQGRIELLEAAVV